MDCEVEMALRLVSIAEQEEVRRVELDANTVFHPRARMSPVFATV